MRRVLVHLIAGATLFAPAAAHAQPLAARIAAAPADASVRFQFEARPGVCGDGESIMIDDDRSRDGVTIVRHDAGGSSWTSSRDRFDENGRLRECRTGPVVLELERSGGRITAATPRVGATTFRSTIDLGTVTPQEATQFLLAEETLRTPHHRAGERMIFTATLAAVETWPSLLRLARAQQLHSDVRNQAIFWLAQAAGDRATDGLVSIIGDDSDEIEVRKHAVFALSRVEGSGSVDRLMEIARTNREPEVRRTAMFWLSRSGDARVVDFFEQILRGG